MTMSPGRNEGASIIFTYALNIFRSTAPGNTTLSVEPSMRTEDSTVTVFQWPQGAESWQREPWAERP